MTSWANELTVGTLTMNAFEALISMLLRHDGYWTIPNFKVELTREEKQQIGRHSSPRWELDVLAYRGATNEVLVVECKSFLDSPGVSFRNGSFAKPERYKLFTEPVLREVVFARLSKQLLEAGFVQNSPKVRLCLAVGKIARNTDRERMREYFKDNGWQLWDAAWIEQRLTAASETSYENDVAFVVSKLLLRNRDRL